MSSIKLSDDRFINFKMIDARDTRIHAIIVGDDVKLTFYPSEETIAKKGDSAPTEVVASILNKNSGYVEAVSTAVGEETHYIISYAAVRGFYEKAA